MPSDTPEEFRERAATCERIAGEVKDQNARETLLYLASRWHAMADEDEQRLNPTKPESESLSSMD